MKQERLNINRLHGRGTSTFVQLPDDDCLRTLKKGRCTLPPSLIAAQFNFHLQLHVLVNFLIACQRAVNYQTLGNSRDTNSALLNWE